MGGVAVSYHDMKKIGRNLGLRGDPVSCREMTEKEGGEGLP